MNTILEQATKILETKIPEGLALKLQRAKQQRERFLELVAKGVVKKKEFNIPTRQEMEQRFYSLVNQRGVDRA